MTFLLFAQQLLIIGLVNKDMQRMGARKKQRETTGAASKSATKKQQSEKNNKQQRDKDVTTSVAKLPKKKKVKQLSKMGNEKSFKDKKQKPVKDKKGNVSYFLNRMSTPYYIFYHI